MTVLAREKLYKYALLRIAVTEKFIMLTLSAIQGEQKILLCSCQQLPKTFFGRVFSLYHNINLFLTSNFRKKIIYSTKSVK